MERRNLGTVMVMEWRFFSLSASRVPRQEALQVVAAGDARLDLEGGVGVAVLEDLDEGDEEVVHAVAELLHVGVLVGRALVAVDRDALVHDVALEVVLLAERLHDELLEVAREELEAVLVGQHDHVLAVPLPPVANTT
jgi:hypothetical protein